MPDPTLYEEWNKFVHAIGWWRFIDWILRVATKVLRKINGA